MHALRVKYKDDRGIEREARIQHHGDWSGEARIVYHNEVGEIVEVEIPAVILVALGGEAAIDRVRDAVIAALEDL